MTDYSELIAEARRYDPGEGSLIERLADALEAHANMQKFEAELARLINRSNIDSSCAVPDYVLAKNIVAHVQSLKQLLMTKALHPSLGNIIGIDCGVTGPNPSREANVMADNPALVTNARAVLAKGDGDE